MIPYMGFLTNAYENVPNVEQAIGMT